MIFENILSETSMENNGGFLSDYVSLGENAALVQNGSRKLFVDFPQKSAAPRSREKSLERKTSKSKDQESLKKKQTAKKRNSGATTKNSANLQSDDLGGLQFEEINLADTDDDNDNSSFDCLEANPYKREAVENVLPDNHTKNIIVTLKKLTLKWAEEEQVMGNNVQCESTILSFGFLLCSSYLSHF
jgi:hypothetical protein